MCFAHAVTCHDGDLTRVSPSPPRQPKTANFGRNRKHVSAFSMSHDPLTYLSMERAPHLEHRRRVVGDDPPSPRRARRLASNRQCNVGVACRAQSAQDVLGTNHSCVPVPVVSVQYVRDEV